MISIGLEWYTMLCICFGFSAGVIAGLAYMEMKDFK